MSSASTSPTAHQAVSAFSRERDPRSAAADLTAQFGTVAPVAVLFFCSHHHDGAALSAALRARYPCTEVVGCTTAGEFVERDGAVGAVSAMALPAGTVRAAHGTLARFDASPSTAADTPSGRVERGVREAAERLARSVGADLRTLDPTRYAGVVLVEGLRMREEDVNVALGGAAPQLAFVGGSAGDGLEFRETRVFHNGDASSDGAALLLLDMAVPFTVAKTCSFEPTTHRFIITRADEANRVVYELDGRPVIEAYAAAIGVAPHELGASVFMTHPLGQMLDGDPWIRSPQQPLADGGLKFYCRISEGAEVHVMRSTDLVAETHAAVARAARTVGGRIGGAIVFNCILRRLELDATDAHPRFRAAFAGVPSAGFHTYGESYLGHINQTCTGLLFA